MSAKTVFKGWNCGLHIVRKKEFHSTFDTFTDQPEENHEPRKSPSRQTVVVLFQTAQRFWIPEERIIIFLTLFFNLLCVAHFLKCKVKLNFFFITFSYSLIWWKSHEATDIFFLQNSTFDLTPNISSFNNIQESCRSVRSILSLRRPVLSTPKKNLSIFLVD